MPVALVLVVVTLVCAEICYWVAKKRGANVALWIALAVFLGPLAVPFVFFAKPKKPKFG